MHQSCDNDLSPYFYPIVQENETLTLSTLTASSLLFKASAATLTPTSNPSTTPPAKTFLQSNIEQLTAIYQLWYILPKLRPFIPDVSSDSPRSEEQCNITYRTSPAAEIQAWRETKKSVSASGCFDREPRSLSVVPPSRMLDRDVKEIQDGRALHDGGFGIVFQP